MLHDLRFALRSCWREPGFSLFAVFTLALGIGAMTMMFSVIHNVLLNPFPYTDPRGMVDVVIRNTADGSQRGGLGTVEYRAFVDESHVFEDAVGAHTEQMAFRAGTGLEPFSAVSLTPNTFRFLGVPAMLGRAFAESDAKAGAPRVAVMSHKTWMAHFGGDPAVVGRTIVLNDTPLTVIGVMPPRFAWNNADVWLPDAAERSDPNGMKKAFWLQARLKRGVTIAEAEAELGAIAVRLAQLYPDRYPKQFRMSVFSVIDWVVGRFRGVLYTLFGAVGLLLLIACCNVANMLLARATIRARAYAIRAALGASRFRIVQQNFFESLMLAIGAGVVGVAFAYAGLAALKPWIPPYGIAEETVIEINGAVLVFSLAVSTLTALIFGVVPILRSTGKDFSVELAASGKGSEMGARHGGYRNFLVISEVALSLVLLCGAGVLMKSFLGLVHKDLGFDSNRLILARVNLPNASLEERRTFFRNAAEAVRAVPGVSQVSISNGYPPYGGSRARFDVPGKVHGEAWKGLIEATDAAYFDTLGVKMMAGSALSTADVAAGRNVAVINETFKSRYFGDEDPVGKTITVEQLNHTSLQVIGVVRDFRNSGPEDAIEPAAYVPYTANPVGTLRLVVRTAIPASAIAPALRPALAQVREGLVQREPVIVSEMLEQSAYARPRFTLILMTVFGALGLILVSTGVYGVMSYVVSRQIREIGIRMALGAQRNQISRWIFGNAFRLIGMGILAGIAASIGANHIITSQLTEVDRFDPAALAIGIGMILLVAAVACLYPAFRATRVDPGITLRQE